MRDSGNIAIESQRRSREDPMTEYMNKNDRDRLEKYERVEQLKLLVEEIRAEERDRKRRKEERKQAKRLLDRKENRKKSKDKKKKKSRKDS
jgi:uncharacterized Zn finger protein